MLGCICSLTYAVACDKSYSLRHSHDKARVNALECEEYGLTINAIFQHGIVQHNSR